MSLLSPDHQIDRFALNLHVSIPSWASWTRCNISVLIGGGITVLQPISSKSSHTVSSGATFLYNLISLFSLCGSGQPSKQNLFSCVHKLSLFGAFIISSNFLSDAGNDVIKLLLKHIMKYFSEVHFKHYIVHLLWVLLTKHQRYKDIFLVCIQLNNQIS